MHFMGAFIHSSVISRVQTQIVGKLVCKTEGQIYKGFSALFFMHSLQRNVHDSYQTGAPAWECKLPVILHAITEMPLSS